MKFIFALLAFVAFASTSQAAITFTQFGANRLRVINVSQSDVTVSVNGDDRFCPRATTFDMPTILTGNDLVSVASTSTALNNAWLVTNFDEDLEIVVGLNASMLYEERSASHWFWFGFYTAFGWAGFGLTLRIVRHLGRTSPEL
ncbi:MAG: hypothetical protein HY043_05215 [Verrucomicrobia bacterium]|nr:hypothetical protein [Verrucomicrobiota bacterium]